MKEVYNGLKKHLTQYLSAVLKKGEAQRELDKILRGTSTPEIDEGVALEGRVKGLDAFILSKEGIITDETTLQVRYARREGDDYVHVYGNPQKYGPYGPFGITYKGRKIEDGWVPAPRSQADINEITIAIVQGFKTGVDNGFLKVGQ